MIARALVAALTCACAAALTPLPAAGDDNDCALYLSGPGRTSAYDYNLNLLKGNFGYDGQHTCITYDAVNQAYLEARNRILVSRPKGDWKAEDFASVGELVLDISINLAKTYGLTYEEIEKGLPLIDTSRTLIREVCPPVFSHVECRAGKYRRLDGLCNNLQHPTWGATMAPFQRLIGPLFADGMNAPRISHTGRDLPLSRVVSRTMHPDDGFHDHAGTIMVIAWGQFMDHDFTLTGTPLDPINRNDPEECCKRPPHLKHPYCNEIRVPDDDYFYRLFGVKCMDFVRAFPSPRPGCRLGSRAPFNTLTGAIDGNTVYGVTEKFARKLRAGYGGLLRMNPVFKEYGLKDLLPLKLDIPEEGCTRPNKNMFCFEAGEIRVNEQLILTVMHTLMAREHNRVAEGLASVNPHWDDETLFQEARRINIAEIQHITYNEFLPILLGKDVMEKFGLVLEKEGYWDGYDVNVNPDVLASFAAAAYRFGHSLLPTAVERWSKAHKFIASKRLSDLIRRPFDLYRAGVIDEYVMGLMNQVAQAMDDSITQEVTNHLFKKVGARFGMDLVSFNMQRGREFGVPGYMEFRKFCGLPSADSFQDLFGSMPNETVVKYESIFEHPIDVDLWSGGVSERPLAGSMLGPTFACIIATQFSYSRRGDRFWFELPNQPSSFTAEQLKEIRKSRLARVICDNTDIIDTVQLYPMVLPDHELNPRVPCRSGIIPSMDFSKWAEPAPFQGTAKQFITDAYIPNKNETIKYDGQKDPKNVNITENNNNYEHLNETVVSQRGCNSNLSNSNIILKENSINKNLHHTLNTKNKGDITKICIDATEVMIDNCDENTVQSNEHNNRDTVLKYVYKKTNKQQVPEKSKGHHKNSLKRKKRSQFPHNNQPLTVNYEISHTPQAFHLTEPKAVNIVKNANFNIATLHEHKNNIKSDAEQQKKESNESVEKSGEESAENEKEYEINPKPQESLNIDENQKYKERETLSLLPHSSSESDENSASGSRERDEIVKYDVPKNRRKESQESNELEVSPVSAYTKPNIEQESTEREDSKENEQIYQKQPPTDSSSESVSEIDKNNENSQSVENSNETEDDTHERKQKYNNLSHIQDVDLGDFSSERIKVSNTGEVDSAHDSDQNIESDTRSNDEPDDNPDSVTKNHNVDQYTSTEKDNGSSSDEEINEKNKPININDDEVKPVIEINSESEDESENSSEVPITSNLDIESESPKTFANDKEVTEENSKLIIDKDDTVNDDVKQQFERIPLNYKHSEQNIKDTNIKLKDSADTPKSDDNDRPQSEGTLDTLAPVNNRYDENLNIKFSDLTIKLPEIKLPEDVVEYAYKSPYYNEPNTKKRKFYHYSDEISEERPDKNKKDEASENRDNEYYGYHEPIEKKQDYKNKKEDNEEDVDLYEKFVRERFGKRGTFENRYEKLQDARPIPANTKLFSNVHNLLKKTEEIKKQAEKSGDPNAGYMWTLEYGQNA